MVNYNEKDYCYIVDYRSKQYKYLSHHIKALLQHYVNNINDEALKKQYFNAKLKFSNITEFRDSTRLLQINLIVDNKSVLELKLPQLDGNQFRIYGTVYIPALYIIDQPIILTAHNTIYIWSLTCPIRIDTRSKQFQVGYRRGAIAEAILYKIIPELFDILDIKGSEDYDNILLTYIGDTSKEYIYKKVESHFMDSITKSLYLHLYNTKDLREILLKGLERYINREYYSYIDLTKRRIIFIEYLLYPLYKAINKAISFNTTIQLNKNAIVKYFFKRGAAFQFSAAYPFIDVFVTKAIYSSAGYVSPDVALLHESYYNKVCPITISNDEPGRVVSLCPNTLIHYKYGILK